MTPDGAIYATEGRRHFVKVIHGRTQRSKCYIASETFDCTNDRVYDGYTIQVLYAEESTADTGYEEYVTVSIERVILSKWEKIA